MKRPAPPAPPPLLAPEPPADVADQPDILQLYVRAKEHYDHRRYDEALGAYEQIAGLNPADGRVSMVVGLLHFWGLGTAPDSAKAQRWLKDAARSGEYVAYVRLAAICFKQGNSQGERAWLEEGANKGYAPALHYLGNGWEFGRFGAVDRRKALAYYERAAGKGYCLSAWRIAVSLLKGERGLTKIPSGLVMYLRSWFKFLVLHLRDPYDERVMY